MATPDLAGVLAKLRKLLALAERAGSEHESLRAMDHVHRLLAEHNLSLDEARARLEHAPPARKLDETQFDAASERWTLRIWHATAALFFCSYFYREETRPDRAGTRRPYRLRHAIVGTAANQVTAKVMADHFCRTIRRLARAYAVESSRGVAARRSFETGCADRLAERIWQRRAEASRPSGAGSRLPALLGLYDQERAANEAALAAMGISLSSGGDRRDRKTADVLAEHLGREAGETVSLALQIGSDVSAKPKQRRPAEPGQMAFGF